MRREVPVDEAGNLQYLILDVTPVKAGNPVIK